MPPHKGQVRFGWRKLSKSYRARLERQGISQRAWEDGADLRKARGKAPKPRPTAPSPDLISRIVRTPTEKDLAELRAMFVRPAWIPRDMSTDVAAALSLLPDPSRWKSVQFIPRPDGEPWTMIVQLKGRAYPITIEIPGGGGPGSGAREVIDFVNGENLKRDKKRARGSEVEDVFADFDRSYTGTE